MPAIGAGVTCWEHPTQKRQISGKIGKIRRRMFNIMPQSGQLPLPPAFPNSAFTVSYHRVNVS
jgi:hypothetical protein